MRALASQFRAMPARRGNTIVLVTAILVLLVVIATAFVSRTRAVRQTSSAQQASAGRDGRAESVGVDVAREIAGALFAKPVDTTPGGIVGPHTVIDTSVTPNVFVASSSWPRLEPSLNSERYSIDRDFLPVADPDENPLPGDGKPDLDYNFAPFEVRPWTNWPDEFGVASSPWPFGRGAPSGRAFDQDNLNLARPIGDSNPYGNPGFGDTRWLRSTEPERVQLPQPLQGTPFTFSFSHWSHLSWLPSANNGWRLVTDISNIEANTVANMNEDPNSDGIRDFNQQLAVALPYEQWLPGVVPAALPPVTAGAAAFKAAWDARRNQWFNNYPVAYRSPAALPNFLALPELGGASDEFRPDTPRNLVSRTFADTDGDGFTDSFWFAAPTTNDRGIRTVVGVSVVDNSALINANVATKGSRRRTVGHTPSDLALVSSIDEYPQGGFGGTHTGFLDGPLNQDDEDYAPTQGLTQFLPTYRWLPDSSTAPVLAQYDRASFGDGGNRQLSFLQAIGLRTPNNLAESGTEALPLADLSLPQNLRGSFESALERTAYFKLVTSNPEQPLFGLTPFDAADEFELRAYHGNNAPFSISRFEQALNPYTPLNSVEDRYRFQFLRSAPIREETTETLDQLTAPQLLLDNRRKLTLFNGARNEQMPPHLWPGNPAWAQNVGANSFGPTPHYEETVNYLQPGGVVPGEPFSVVWNEFQALNRAEYFRRKAKIDLRQPMYTADPDGSGSIEPGQAPFALDSQAYLQWRRDMQAYLENIFIRKVPDANSPGKVESIYGIDLDVARPDSNAQRTRNLVASFVANIESYTDEAEGQVRSGTSTTPPYTVAVETPDAIQLGSPGVPGPALDGQKAVVAHVPIPSPIGSGAALDTMSLGMEKQPFITEVFFGLVYPKSYLTDQERQKWNDVFQLQPAAPQYLEPYDRDELPLSPSIVSQVMDGGGLPFVNSRSDPVPVIVIQVANPYDTPLNLSEFRLNWFGRNISFQQPGTPYGVAPMLAPATLEAPSMATVVAVGRPFTAANNPTGTDPLLLAAQNGAFATAMYDFLDIEARNPAQEDEDGVDEYATLYDSFGTIEEGVDPDDRNLVFKLPTTLFNGALKCPSASGADDAAGNDQYLSFVANPQNGSAIQLQRRLGPPSSSPQWVTVDRFENIAQTRGSSSADGEPRMPITKAIQKLFGDASGFGDSDYVPPRDFVYFSGPNGEYESEDGTVATNTNTPTAPYRVELSGIRLRPDEDFFFVWTRAARPWALDVSTAQAPASYDPALKRIDADELSPRFVFSVATQSFFPLRGIDDVEDPVDSAGLVYGETFIWDRPTINGVEQEFCDYIGASAPAGFGGEVGNEAKQSDPDVFDPATGFWANTNFADAYGRIVTAKPVCFSNVLYTRYPSAGRVTALYEVNGAAIPFLPSLNLPDADGTAGEISEQPWHRIVEYNGVAIEYVVGSKGFHTGEGPNGLQILPPDLQRFLGVPGNAAQTGIGALKIPFELSQKDSDFEQIGEILDVFLWGHVLQINNSASALSGLLNTKATFSEILVSENPAYEYYPGPPGPFLNRLNIEAIGTMSPLYREDPDSQLVFSEPGIESWNPAVPGGTTIFDGLTIDGPGRNNLDRDLAGPDSTNALALSAYEANLIEQRSFRLANGYSGKRTSGLVNINTALPETLQALPMSYAFPNRENVYLPPPYGATPYVRYPQALAGYRAGQWAGYTGPYASVLQPNIAGFDVYGLSVPVAAPTYADRGYFQSQIDALQLTNFFPDPEDEPGAFARFFPGMRADRGFMSVGELALLARTALSPGNPGLTEQGTRNSYSIRAFGLDLYDRRPLLVEDPLGYPTEEELANAADVDDFGDIYTFYSHNYGIDTLKARPRMLPYDTTLALYEGNDFDEFARLPGKNSKPAGTAGSLNLLFKGISNLVTTRSDVFTVYLRVRQVRQNPTTGVWDGSSSEYIVDDSRYVMCVDRSECNTPTDEPKILYFQKCPW